MATEAEGQKTPEERIEALEEAMGSILDMLEDITKKVGALDKQVVKKSSGLFGGKRKKTAIRDTKTGSIYPSKANVGKQLAGTPDFPDVDKADNFAWYKLIAAAPDRFVDASDEEAEKVWKAEADARAKEVEEANKRLAAEEAAKKAEEAKAAKK